jgi:predicted kinase
VSKPADFTALNRLVVLGGLPGTGKTTLAREVSRRHGAFYLRIDTIEQSIRAWMPGDIGPAGYAVAMALARENLSHRDRAGGQTVVVDAVNPVVECREAWREIAAKTAVPLLEIEVVCSDASEHRRRVETRRSDIEGLVPPTWDEVVGRYYVPWGEPHWIIDTAVMSVEEAVQAIGARMTE